MRTINDYTKKKLKKVISLVLSVCVTAAAFLIFLKSGNLSSADTEKISLTFLNVGQGDAILISTPNGFCLIDTGPASAHDDLINALSAAGVSGLSLFFLTHTDSDHAANAPSVIEKFSPVSLWLPDTAAESSCMTEIKKAAYKSGCELRQCRSGNIFYLGQTELCILSPGDTLSGDENSDSLVILLKHGEGRALLMGDADTETEKRLIAAYGNEILHCDILKAGHHGADTSSSDEFLQAANPSYAVISCGRANSFGHPHAAVLRRLEKNNITVLRTDLSGNISFVSSGGSFVRK